MTMIFVIAISLLSLLGGDLHIDGSLRLKDSRGGQIFCRSLVFVCVLCLSPSAYVFTLFVCAFL